MKTKTQISKQILSLVLALAMLITMLPGFTLTASAADTDTGKAIQLGAPQIEGGQADSIYFGTYQQSSDGNGGYNTDPIKWRVLSNADGKLFLLSDQNLDVFQYHTDDWDEAPPTVTWESSTMRSWLNGYGASSNNGDWGLGIDYSSNNFLDNAFSESEQGAIAETTGIDDYNSNFDKAGNNTTDKVFLLSLAEVENTSYFADQSSRIATNTAYVAGGGEIESSEMEYGEGVADFWWLRTLGGSNYYATYVWNTGEVAWSGVDMNHKDLVVRPAFNLNLNSVLFTSAADNSGHNSSFAAPADYDGSEWKVTLKDDNDFSMVASVSGSTTLIAGYSDATLTINHSALGYFLTAVYTNVTAMLTDASGDILYYGSINDDIWATSSTVTIPAGLAAGEYTLSVYGEDWNGENYTDYATGTPLTTTITVHEHSWEDMPDGGQVCTDCGYTLYDIWVGGVQVGGVPDESGNITVTGDTITGTVTYAPSTKTLTLDGASITAAETPVDVAYGNTPPCGIYSRPALNLVLTGENTITASTTDYSNGVKADAMDLAISGGGSLTINNCGYGIQANDLVTDDVTIEIIDSVFAISLNTGCAIEDSTVSAVGSNKGISTINGTIGIDNSSVYVKGGSYSFYGSSEVVSVRLSSGAHVKAEGAIKIGLGINSSLVGYLRTASGGMFAGKEGSLETGSGYFEYVGNGHYKDIATIDGEEHIIECQDGNCLLTLTDASALHFWNATTDGADCADCPANADASVMADTTTDYYVFVDNAVIAAEETSGSILKLFDNEESITIEQGGFTLDPNGRSIETLNFKSGSSSIGIASKPGNTPAVSAVDYGVFATPSGVTLEAEWFKSDMTGYVVVKDGDNLKLVPGITEDLVEVAESATYNGSAQTPAVTVKWTDGSGAYLTLTKDTNYTVNYTDSNGNSVTAPTYADTYTVTITGVDYASKVEKTYTINKAPVPTITYPAAGGLTYGQTLADSVLSGGSTEYGSFAWKDETTVPAVGSAGYPVTFTVNENTAKNYETITTTEQNVQVSVTQAAPGISLSASVSGASGNRTVELTATVSAAGSGVLPTGTVRFVNATDGGSTEIGAANVSDGTATCTWTATEDKVYTIRAVYNGDTNYQAVNTSKEVDTNKQPQAVLTITSGTTVAYGQTLTLTTTGGSTNGTVTYTVTPSNVASVSGNVLTPTTVGSVTVTATMAGNDTYLDVTSAPVTITITQGTGIGSVTMAGWTYGETAKTPAVTSETNGTDNVTYLYESTDGKGYSSDAAPTTAGAYKVTATFAATDLYAKTTDSAEFTVEKAEPAVKTVPTATRIQRGKKLEASTIKGGEMIGVDGTTLEGTFTWKAPETVMYTTGNIDAIVVFTPNDTTNYKAVEITVSVEVYTTSGGIVVTPTYYDVKFDTNGAGTIAKQTVRRNSTATEPADPVKDGYTFGGWYTDKECTKAYNFDTKVTKDITLYAKWTENKLVTILWRLEGEPVQETSADFFDVPAGQWYTDAIQWASANGIVNGYGNGLFGPNDDITREQLATILYRYEQYKGGGFVGAWMFRMDYVDLAEVSDWAYEAMCWMTMNGIVNGRPGKVLDPKGTATRAEAATMLYRYCEDSGKENDN